MADLQRLFVAILLPPDIEADLDDVIDPLRDAVPDLRWSPAAHWHITLEFLGTCGVYEAERQRLRWRERAASHPPMQLSLAGGGAFPYTIGAKVLWTGIAGDVALWRKLAIDDQQPHLTLARSRRARDLTGPVSTLAAYAGPSWSVDKIALVISHLRGVDSRGPRYEVVEFFNLGQQT